MLLHNGLHICQSCNLVFSKLLPKTQSPKTSFNENENLFLSSPNSFHIQSQNIDGISTFPNLKFINYRSLSIIIYTVQSITLLFDSNLRHVTPKVLHLPLYNLHHEKIL